MHWFLKLRRKRDLFGTVLPLAAFHVQHAGEVCVCVRTRKLFFNQVVYTRTVKLLYHYWT